MQQYTPFTKFLRFLRRYNRYIKVAVIAMIALTIALLPTAALGIPGLTPIQQRMIAIFVWAALMWIVEAVPAWTTSLLIIVIMLLTVSDSGIEPLIKDYDKQTELMSYKEIMGCFANPTVMLFMGGFILALVASKSGVDVSMARAMLKPFGS
ncbi:MAG: anion permease, partial [Bacteroidaceae bacterium]|nr:anion permease [Bacteroidaceae bacterium]